MLFAWYHAIIEGSIQWSNLLNLYVMMLGESFKISICCVFIISIIIIFCYKLNKFTLYIFLDVAPMSFGANFSQHVGEIESVDWRLTMSWVTLKWLLMQDWMRGAFVLVGYIWDYVILPASDSVQLHITPSVRLFV